MLAVVDIFGQQFKVKEKDTVVVPHLSAEPNSEVSFDKVMMVTGENGTQVGTPYTSHKVLAKVLEHGHDDTVLVFKKKRRTGYQKSRGHREQYTKIEIVKIG